MGLRWRSFDLTSMKTKMSVAKSSGKWYAVYTKPRWEKKVFSLMTERGMVAYCPLNKVRRKWSDRIKTVEEPLFSSYVFVQVSEEMLSEVRMVGGVVNFVYWQGKPAVIPEREILIIKKFLNEYDDVVAEPLHLEKDGRVTITRGLFMDHQAKVITVEGNRVKVVIESLGYTLIASVEKRNLSTINR